MKAEGDDPPQTPPSAARLETRETQRMGSRKIRAASLASIILGIFVIVYMRRNSRTLGNGLVG